MMKAFLRNLFPAVGLASIAMALMVAINLNAMATALDNARIAPEGFIGLWMVSVGAIASLALISVSTGFRIANSTIWLVWFAILCFGCGLVGGLNLLYDLSRETIQFLILTGFAFNGFILVIRGDTIPDLKEMMARA